MLVLRLVLLHAGPHHVLVLCMHRRADVVDPGAPAAKDIHVAHKRRVGRLLVSSHGHVLRGKKMDCVVLAKKEDKIRNAGWRQKLK